MMPTTRDKAEQRLCPFTIGLPPAERTMCLTGSCMAWRVVHAAHRREDHSGARDHLMSEGLKTGRTARREGGPMSSGFWVLDEVGVCARLSST